MKFSIFFKLAILLTILLPCDLISGTITTKITSHNTINSEGITFRGELLNLGDETAYNTLIFVFLNDRVEQNNLGNNPPGNQLNFKINFKTPELKPGKYTAVIRINFEEQNGISHKAYHIANLTHKEEIIRNLNKKISFSITPPSFNAKSFWQKRGYFNILAKNGFTDEISLYISLFLPDGFNNISGTTIIKLLASKEKNQFIPIEITSLDQINKSYNLVIWYEQNGINYSYHKEGTINVLSKPMFFIWYVIIGMSILGIFVLFLLYFKYRK